MDDTVTVQLERRVRSTDYGKGFKGYGPDEEIRKLWDQLVDMAKANEIPVVRKDTKIDNTGTRRHQFPTIDVTDITTLTFAIPAAAFTIAKGAEFIKLLLEIADKALDVRKKYREMKDEHSHYRNIDITIHERDHQIKLEDEKFGAEVERILQEADDDN